MGKGSGRRPMKITQEELRDNWDRIFNKKEKKDGNKSNTTDAQEAARKWGVSTHTDSGAVERVQQDEN